MPQLLIEITKETHRLLSTAATHHDVRIPLLAAAVLELGMHHHEILPKAAAALPRKTRRGKRPAPRVLSHHPVTWVLAPDSWDYSRAQRIVSNMLSRRPPPKVVSPLTGNLLLKPEGHATEGMRWCMLALNETQATQLHEMTQGDLRPEQCDRYGHPNHVLAEYFRGLNEQRKDLLDTLDPLP